MIGKLRFATHNESNPNFNLNYSYEVNKYGGLHKLVKSNVARNMWSIMKEFKVLPNDPLLKSLSVQSLDFIIESMQQDAKEVERAEKGLSPEAETEYTDTDFESFWNDPNPGTALAEGDDPDDIYRQVQEVTEDKDYDSRLDEKIEQALAESKQIDSNVDAQIEENYNKLKSDMQDKGIDVNNIF